MPETATLSVAEPLIVKGLVDAPLITIPFVGVVTADAGAAVSIVVYENA
jgi:hypothetical protein